jgi:hypothetical protein
MKAIINTFLATIIYCVSLSAQTDSIKKQVPDKVSYVWSMNGLPESILSFMKNNSNKTVEFDTNYYEKHINNKGEISYVIHIWDNGIPYFMKLNSSGEILSKTKQIVYKE